MDKLLDKEILLEKNVYIEDCDLISQIWVRTGSSVIKSKIGSDVFIGFRCLIENSSIGNYTQIASKVKIGGKKRNTKIEDFCWIGANATIYSGVTIGTGSIIGANTIIKEDIPPNTIAYGKNHLVVKPREYIKDSYPHFRLMLKKNLKRKLVEGDYWNVDKKGNYITAEIKGYSNYQIGCNNILIGNRSTSGYIKIGNNVKILNNCIFEGSGKITIGDNTIIGNNVHIVSSSHNYKLQSLPMIFQPVEIGDNSIIENNSIILGGISISSNSIITQNSFIIKNIQEESHDKNTSSSKSYRDWT